MNILKALIQSAFSKAVEELGIKINEVKLAQFVKYALTKIPKAELADWLDEVIEGKTLSEPLSDLATHEAISEIEEWADAILHPPPNPT